MSIEIRGEEAIDAARKSMKDREVFTLFGIDYIIGSVTVEYREISDVVFAQVDMRRVSTSKQSAKVVNLDEQAA